SHNNRAAKTAALAYANSVAADVDTRNTHGTTTHSRRSYCRITIGADIVDTASIDGNRGTLPRRQRNSTLTECETSARRSTVHIDKQVDAPTSSRANIGRG